MNKKKLSEKVFLVAGALFLAFFLLGFITPFFIASGRTACTLMACSCEGVQGETPCNICYYEKPIFITGLLNVFQSCSGRELIFCSNGKQIGRKTDFSEGSCNYRLGFFELS